MVVSVPGWSGIIACVPASIRIPKTLLAFTFNFVSPSLSNRSCGLGLSVLSDAGLFSARESSEQTPVLERALEVDYLE
jgi:hypothetical protein